MMKKILLTVLSLLSFCSIYSQVTIAIEDFDGGSPAWINDIASQACVDPNSPNQGLFIQPETTNPNFVGNVAHGQDLQGEASDIPICLANYPYVFTFSDISVTGFSNIVARFDYNVSAVSDNGNYEWIIDGVGQGPQTLYSASNGISSGRITNNVGIANTIGLVLSGTLNSANDVLDFDNFVIEGDITVPVTYTYIVLNSDVTSIILSWATASEVNNDYFDIEHSLDGENFTTIGRVGAKGNSRAIGDYSFTHDHPIQGMHYYRLKQVDLDGTYAHSEVKNIEMVKEGEVTLFPSMVQDRITIRHNFLDAARVRIINMSGQEMIRYDKVDTETSIDVSTLTPNVYIVNVISGAQQVTKKIVKQ